MLTKGACQLDDVLGLTTGVGIPPENPNLDSSVENKVSDIFDLVKSGSIVVSAEQGNLVK